MCIYTKNISLTFLVSLIHYIHYYYYNTSFFRSCFVIFSLEGLIRHCWVCIYAIGLTGESTRAARFYICTSLPKLTPCVYIYGTFLLYPYILLQVGYCILLYRNTIFENMYEFIFFFFIFFLSISSLKFSVKPFVIVWEILFFIVHENE